MAVSEFNTGVIRPIECVREGWELIKNEYWLMFAISLVGGLLAGVTVYVLLGAMICGIFGCYLKKIDGEPVVVSAVDVDPADVLYTRPDLVNEFGPEITDIEAEVLASGLTARIPE